ncbi:hypothetical protein TSAR_009410, partial [Trichomalopsis sarcophagae]
SKPPRLNRLSDHLPGTSNLLAVLLTIASKPYSSFCIVEYCPSVTDIARASAFDQFRDLDANLDTSSLSIDSPGSSKPSISLSPACPSAPGSQTQIAMSMVPSNWNEMTTSQQMAALFNRIELRVHAPDSTELKIDTKILILLDLQSLQCDILEVRQISLSYSDIVLGASADQIGIYEMTPPLINNLRNQAKAIAAERGYKHVWVSRNNVFVRKTDTSSIVPIVTQADIDKIA